MGLMNQALIEGSMEDLQEIICTVGELREAPWKRHVKGALGDVQDSS